MSKIQINKGDLRRIVESTVRAIINENGVNRLINEGYGREFSNLSEAYKSSKIRNIMNQNGGAWYLVFGSGYCRMDYYGRCNGYSVRGVRA